MPAQTTINPHQTLSVADSAAEQLTQASAPAQDVTPTSGGALSNFDRAGQAVAVKIAGRFAQMAGELAGTGPATSNTTHTGVNQLQQTDEDNALALRALGTQGSTYI